jgi:hypothetical protein
MHAGMNPYESSVCERIHTSIKEKGCLMEYFSPPHCPTIRANHHPSKQCRTCPACHPFSSCLISKVICGKITLEGTMGKSKAETALQSICSRLCRLHGIFEFLADELDATAAS